MNGNDVIYLGISNNDDALHQMEWSLFVKDFRAVGNEAGDVIGDWVSEPSAPWQNACLCVRVKPARQAWLKAALGDLAHQYRQKWGITYAPAETVMIGDRIGLQ